MRWTKLNPRKVRRTVALAALGAAALLAGPFAAKSHAGTYQAYDCAADTGGYSQAQYEQTHAMAVAGASCGAGGNGLSIAVPVNYWTPSQTGASWTISVPAGTHFINVNLFQRGAPGDGYDLEVFAIGPGGAIPLGASKVGGPAWHGLGAFSGYFTAVTSRLTCNSGSGCAGSLQAGTFTRDFAFTMADDVAPALRVSGPLLDDTVQRGTGLVDVASTDSGAGLTQAFVLVNDQVAQSQSFGCPGASVKNMQPCQLSAAGDFELDTQRSPFHDGANAVQACAADYGVPANVSCGAEQVVRVDNSCAPSGVPGGANLSALFPRSKSDEVDVHAGEGALLTGQLTDNSGDPITHATLCMREGVAGQGLDDAGTVKTDADGRYRYGVTPGPNRRLEVGYRFNRNQIERHAEFFSRLRPRLHLSPKHRADNGDSLRLYGSIPGPSNEDRVVILQAGYPHSKQWKTFAKARTDSDGRYLTRYRFSATYATTNYRMRAVVPQQNGYPYKGGASRLRRITVIGHASAR